MKKINGKYYNTKINYFTGEEYKRFIEFAFNHSTEVYLKLKNTNTFEDLIKLNDYSFFKKIINREKVFKLTPEKFDYKDFTDIIYFSPILELKEFLLKFNNIFDLKAPNVFVENVSFIGGYSRHRMWFESFSDLGDTAIDLMFYNEFLKNF